MPIETLMERLEYDRYGDPEVIRLRAFDLRTPLAHEVLVDVVAASINPMDWKICRGEMRMLTGFRFPRALGTDFSGVVRSVGSSVSRFARGDAIVGSVTMKAAGAFAPRLITNENLIVRKPANLTFAEAACLPIAGVTAWQVLVNKGHLKPEDKVFVNGAMGAVGQAAVSIARSIGADVVGRVGAHSIGHERLVGLSRTLDYTRPLPVSLYGSFDIVFDCSGYLSVNESSRLLKPGGKVFDIAPTRFKFLRALVSPSRKVIFSDPRAENLQRVVDLAEKRDLVITIARTISLSEASSVIASLARGTLRGKTVIQL